MLRTRPSTVTLGEVRQSLGLVASDVTTRTHRVVIVGHYEGPDGKGTFERSYEPDGSFEHRMDPEGGHTQIERFDGVTLWVDSDEAGAYPMTPSHARVASSVEWTLAGRWLQDVDSPFEADFERPREDGEGPWVRLTLLPEGYATELQLHPTSLLPSELSVPRRKGIQRLEFFDWRTRRGFAWPYEIRIHGPKGRATILRTDEVRFEPSMHMGAEYERPSALRDQTFFANPMGAAPPLRRTASGHILVRPLLDGREVGWFLLDTGTGVNCLDPTVLDRIPDFLKSGEDGRREVSIVGLGGSVQGELHAGGSLELGAMRAEALEWVTLDLAPLLEVVGVPLAGVLGGDLFERAVVDIDLSAQTIALHDPEAFDGSRLPWRALRFDGPTPCIPCAFAPDQEGWFRLDTGSDDTVTFHAPWVKKLGMVRRARNLVQIRLRGIGGEIQAVQGRIAWFEMLGMRIPSPRVTLVEQATGPLANPDLVGNLGVGFLTGQRLILDFPHHRVTLIPR